MQPSKLLGYLGLLLVMVVGLLGPRFLPPPWGWALAIGCLAIVAFGRRSVMKALKRDLDNPPPSPRDDAEDPYEQASATKKLVVDVLNYGGLIVMGVGIWLVLKGLRDEEFNLVADPIHLGAAMAVGGALVAAFPRFVLLSK